MAAPSYTTDLTLITEATGTTGWDESSNASWDDAGAMVDETNFYIQNGACVSAQFTKDGVGTILFVDGTSRTVPTDGAVLIWHFWASPPSLATLALGGIRMCVGNSVGDFKAWDVSGSDFEPSPLGGWWNFAVDPSQTADDTVGTVSSPYTTFGIAVSATAQARGNPNAVDVIRFGRCEARYNGGDLANGYATFEGFSILDNAATARWALLQYAQGGYRWQGLMTLGYTSAVDFRDSNRNIVVGNTLKVSANFNKIEVRQATSNVEWTAISIQAIGTVSKGRFEVIDDATVLKTSCTFTDMDSFIYKSNSTLLTSTFRRCGLITQGSATFTGCTFDKAAGTVALASNALNSITKCVFNSSGAGYGVDLGTIGADTSVDWDNTESGYVAGSTGTDVGVTPTGDETIYVNVSSGFVLTVNVQTGASTPSIANAGAGTVNVVAGLVTATFNVSPSITGYEYALYTVTASGSLAGATEVQHAEVHNSATFGYTYTYSAGTILAVQLLFGDGSVNDFEEYLEYYTLASSDQTIAVNLTPDNNN